MKFILLSLLLLSCATNFNEIRYKAPSLILISGPNEKALVKLEGNVISRNDLILNFDLINNNYYLTNLFIPEFKMEQRDSKIDLISSVNKTIIWPSKGEKNNQKYIENIKSNASKVIYSYKGINFELNLERNASSKVVKINKKIINSSSEDGLAIQNLNAEFKRINILIVTLEIKNKRSIQKENDWIEFKIRYYDKNDIEIIDDGTFNLKNINMQVSYIYKEVDVCPFLPDKILKSKIETEFPKNTRKVIFEGEGIKFLIDLSNIHVQVKN